MLMLLGLPAMILRLGFYALQGLAGVLRGRKRLHAERTVLINAPRNAIWRFVTADRTVFDGWPAATDLTREPVPGDGELYLSRIRIGGQEIARVAMRELERDEAAGTVRVQCVPGHKLTHPPAFATDRLTAVKIETRPEGIALTLSEDQTVGAFKDRMSSRSRCSGAPRGSSGSARRTPGTRAGLRLLWTGAIVLACRSSPC
jgi:hypothetical protein